MALPIGNVNLRFTCCTFLALTKSTPSYCTRFEQYGLGLLNYCQNDYQGYGGPSAYVHQKGRRLSDHAYESKTRISTKGIVQSPIVLNVDLSSKQIYHDDGSSIQNDTAFPLRQINGDFDTIGAAMKRGVEWIYLIRLFFDTGVQKELIYKSGGNNIIAVPPMDLFNETIQDHHPSRVIKDNESSLRVVVDGVHGNITKFDIDQVHLK